MTNPPGGPSQPARRVLPATSLSDSAWIGRPLLPASGGRSVLVGALLGMAVMGCGQPDEGQDEGDDQAEALFDRLLRAEEEHESGKPLADALFGYLLSLEGQREDPEWTERGAPPAAQPPARPSRCCHVSCAGWSGYYQELAGGTGECHAVAARFCQWFGIKLDDALWGTSRSCGAGTLTREVHFQ